ncbi:MAG: redoxin domain-containing protein, partial [Gemmataceae bacterium]
MLSFFLFRAHCPTPDAEPAPAEVVKKDEPVPPAPPISNFALNDSAGHECSLADFKDKKAIAIVFIGTECPLVNLYVGRLAEMQREYGPRGLQILAVNSNGHDSVEAIAKHAASRHLPFPVLVDADQRVADRLKAARTPEAILLDAGWIVRYRGRIDDQYAVGADRRSPLRHDLKEAIIDVLAGKTVRVAETKVEGCFISRAVAPAPQEPERQVTYCRDVAP